MDYALEIFLKGHNSSDNRTLGIPSTVTQNNPNLTKPHEYTIHGGLDPYSAIVARTLGENYTFFDRQAIVVSDGIQLVDHDDDIPVIGPPLQPQSDEVSPQGTVRDALTMGVGNGGNGGGSLNDRVNGISVSGVTANGFTLAWSAANGADGYRVRYWHDENAVSVAPVTGTTYTVTGLDPATEYSAQIMAVVNGNVVTSKSSSVITVTTAAAAAPTATPTPAPTATPAPQACNLPSDAITVSEVTGWRDALDANRAAAGIKRWNRVLEALGVDTGAGVTPMTATQAQGVANWLGNTRWDRTARTLEAMAQCQNSPAPTATPTPTPTPPPTPAPTPTPTPAPTPTPTPAPTPTPTPAPQACNLPSDAITVVEVTGWRDALDPNRAAAGIKRWNRVLATFGEDTGENPMTPELARQVANWLKNDRWDRTARTLEAMAQCNG